MKKIFLYAFLVLIFVGIVIASEGVDITGVTPVGGTDAGGITVDYHLDFDVPLLEADAVSGTIGDSGYNVILRPIHNDYGDEDVHGSCGINHPIGGHLSNAVFRSEHTDTYTRETDEFTFSITVTFNAEGQFTCSWDFQLKNPPPPPPPPPEGNVPEFSNTGLIIAVIVIAASGIFLMKKGGRINQAGQKYKKKIT